MSARAARPDPLSIHASAVVIGEDAVLIRGAPGAGKSALALALVAAARARGGFALLVADDRVLLHPAGARLIVSPHPAIAGRVERRFAGIADISHETRAVARLVVDLEPADAPGIARLPPESARWTSLAGIRLRRLGLPQSHAGAVETILHTLANSAANSPE